MVLGIVFIALVALWALFLVVLPYLYMVVESFHPTLRPVERGGPKDVLTIAQYQSFFVDAHRRWVGTRTHMGAFVFSIVASIAVTALNFAICYPLAFYMAQSGTPQKVRLILLALIVPYWVNEILRAFSLRLLLASKGLINQVLMATRPDRCADRFPRHQCRPLCRPVLRLPAGDDLPALQRHRKPGQEPDRGGARPGRALVAHPQGHRHPLCQARHRLGLHHGLHAGGRIAGGAAIPGRTAARCGSRRSSTTSSSRPSIGRAAPPTPSSCWPPASCSSCSMLRLFKVSLGETIK